MRFANHFRQVGAAAALAGLAFGLFCGSESAAGTSRALVAASGAELRWRALDLAEIGDGIHAIAIDRAGRLAAGNARGVVFGIPGSPLRRVALRGELRDLAFFEGDRARGPALFAATELGLHRILSDGRVEAVAPGPGADANAVSRIAVAGRAIAVATEAGAFASTDGRNWQRLSRELPSGAATAIALAERDDVIECWTAIRGELWRIAVRVEAGRIASAAPLRVSIPFASSQRQPIDIALDVGDAEVAIVFDDELVVREPADPSAAGARAAHDGWKQLRPALPPGASALRLAAALGRYWLATDRGLLVADSLRGPWRRGLGDTGSDPIFDLATDRGALYAATENGLAIAEFASTHRSRPDGEATSPHEQARSNAPTRETGAPHFAERPSNAENAASLASVAAAQMEIPQPEVDPNEPDIQSVHRAALRYLSLDPSRIAALRLGVSRRGWLPILAFRATSGRDRSRHSDYDEAFVSGEMRRFNDRDFDRDRQLELQLTVSWDLGDVAYHPESIDVSREAREVIELRDDVLDEITQLYFERRRALAAASQSSDSPISSEHRLRAAQLAAGIDAWTGGWFGRQLSTPRRDSGPATH